MGNFVVLPGILIPAIQQNYWKTCRISIRTSRIEVEGYKFVVRLLKSSCKIQNLSSLEQVYKKTKSSSLKQMSKVPEQVGYPHCSASHLVWETFSQSSPTRVRFYAEVLKVSFKAPTHLGWASQNKICYVTGTSDCKFPQIFCSVSICCIYFSGFLRFNVSDYCGYFSFYNWLVFAHLKNSLFKFLLRMLLCYSEIAVFCICTFLYYLGTLV